MFKSTSKSFFCITDIQIYLIIETLLYFNYYELVLSFKVSFDKWFNFQDIKYGLSSYKQSCFFFLKRNMVKIIITLSFYHMKSLIRKAFLL